MKKRSFIGVLLIFNCLLICSIGISITEVQAAKKIKLSANRMELNVGKKKVLRVKNLSQNKRVKWSVAAGKKCITLLEKKKNRVTVKAKKEGIAQVVAKIGTKKYRCKIYVRNKKNTGATVGPTYVPVSDETPKPEGSVIPTAGGSTTPVPEKSTVPAGNATIAPGISATPIPGESTTIAPETSEAPGGDIILPTDTPDDITERIYEYLDLDQNWSEITIPENVEEGAEIYYMESNVFEDAKGRNFRLDYLPETTVEAYVYAYEVEQVEAGGVTFTFQKDSDTRNDNNNTKDNETEFIEYFTLPILDENQLENFEKDELTIKTSYDTCTTYPDYEYDAEGNRYEYGEFAYYPNFKDSAIETSFDVQAGSLGEGAYIKPVKYHKINIAVRTKGEHWVEIYYKGELVNEENILLNTNINRHSAFM